jgi:hypothetical protein
MFASLSAAQVAAANEEAVLTRRKEIESNRRARLTDKSYKVGIDTSALSSQIADKNASKLEEAASDAAFDEMRLNVDKHLMYVDQQRDTYLRQRDMAVDDFRRSQQKKQDRREYDLNDPNGLKKDAPVRLGDDDASVSVSSLQKFAGEDLHNVERVRQQQAQLRAWAAAQMAEKEAKTAAERQTDSMWANHMLEADLLRCEFADKEAEIYRQRLAELTEYNLAQADFKKTLRQEEHVQAEIDNATEIQAQINSGFLNEDPALTRSFVQPHRCARPAPRSLLANQRTATRRLLLRAFLFDRSPGGTLSRVRGLQGTGGSFQGLDCSAESGHQRRAREASRGAQGG